VEVRDLEKVDPGSGYLIIFNYPSFYTMFLLMKLFPDASIIAAAFVSRIPLLGQFMKQIGTIFVDPKKGRKTYQAIEIALEGGVESVIILPEGERTPDGHVQDFKRGFTYILKHSSLDLLPVTLNGFYTLKPVKRFYLDPDTNLEVVIHRPLRNSDIQKLTDRELRETAESNQRRLQAIINELCGRVERVHWGERNKAPSLPLGFDRPSIYAIDCVVVSACFN